MKPIQVKMKAFGPYLETTTIDFRKLEDNRVFLITGSTGGGKTTILDAMCFALYCRATGGLKTWKDMRNISALDDVETMVEFEFELDKKVYVFKRVLKIHYVRGSGRKEFRDEHECFEKINGCLHLLIAGSESKIREYAEKIIGLNCEQFSKVIVLPQGEFKSLLLATSTEKEKIFEKLFLSNKWNKILDIAKLRVNNFKNELDSLRSLLDAIFQSEEVKNIDMLKDKLSLKNEELEKTQQNAHEYELKISKMNDMLEKIKEFNHIEVKLNNDINTVSKFKDKAAELEALFNNIKNKEKDLITLKQENDELVIKISNLERIVVNKQRLKFLEDKIKQNEVDYKKEKNNSDILKNKLNGIVENIEKAKDYIDNSIAQITLIPKFLDHINSYNRILELNDVVVNLELGLEKINKDYISYNEKVNLKELTLKTLKLNLKEYEMKLKENMVASIALTLKKNEPCPVCGSEVHPNVFNLKKDDYGILECKIKELKLTIDSEEKELHNLKVRLSNTKLNYDNSMEKYLENKNLFSKFNMGKDKALEQLNKYNDLLNKANNCKDTLSRAEKKLEQREKEKEILLKEIDDNVKKIHSISLELEKSISEKKVLIEDCRDNNKEIDALNLDLHSLKSRIVEIEKIQDDIKEKSTNIKSELDASKANLSYANKIYDDDYKKLNELKLILKNEITNIDNYQENILKLQEEKSKLLKYVGKLQQQIAQLSNSINMLSENENKLNSIEKKYSMNKRVLDLMQGKNNYKIPIKMFILSIMLDEILNYANIYFSIFSNARYAISRKCGKTLGQGYGGLDVEVFDAYLGGVRDVDTLSGGEMFLASLSLAFGLSDAVQSNAGAIHLNSIFIDEGFGSLDQSTLDIAIKAINKIQSMGRMVGIISHVNELRDRISTKIEVINKDIYNKEIFITN